MGCHNSPVSQKVSTVIHPSHLTMPVPDPKTFNQEIDGKPVRLYQLSNHKGMKVDITNFGGRLVGIWVPDFQGHSTDVILGYDSLQGYLRDRKTYFGALIGRYGNRISKGRFMLDGKSYFLAINNPPNSLHGGQRGFDSRVWDASQPDSTTLLLTYLSPDMEEGYPGNLRVQVTYSVDDSNNLKISYQASTNKNTVINLTNHAYFNLSGEGYPTNRNTVLMIRASRYTPVDSTLIPTGKLVPVAGTPFDFTKPISIGARIGEPNQQLEFAGGYDQNFVLDPCSAPPCLAAMAYSPLTGIELKVLTDQPGIQFYSGNFLDGQNIGIGGKPYPKQSAFCLETQHFPDSPNHPQFPSTELKRGSVFHSTTIYHFGLHKE